jgi:hypothetical protein
MSTRRYRIAQLRHILPDFGNYELNCLYNLAKNHRYNQNRLDKLPKAETESTEREITAISITNSNLDAFEWAIEELTGEKFQVIDWIVNEEIGDY